MNHWIPAISALTGSIVGGLISFLATYILKSREWNNDRVNRELEKRENLYSAFMAESTRLLLMSVDEKSRTATEFSVMIDLLMRIRMTSSERVVDAAEAVVKHVTSKHIDEKTESEKNDSNDKYKSGFTAACRKELEKLKKEG